MYQKKMLYDIISNNEDALQDNNVESDELVTCRICYDVDKNESPISPCNCVGSHAYVHMSCLEQWLSVSKSSTCDICSYTFKTIEHTLTLFEWFREKRNCQGFFQQFLVMFLFVCIWSIVLAACAIKTVEFFSDTEDTNSVCNGILMSVITLTMAVMLWFWAVIFRSLWKRTNMVIRLDKNFRYENENINIVTQV